MGKHPTFLLLFLWMLTIELCQAEDMMTMTMIPQEEVTHIQISPILKMSRKQILAAQFECYLKILHDPPHTEPGSYCNRTWDGWLCWGDEAPGTIMQNCPTYFQDFDPAEKVIKVCNPDGQWFRHPQSDRVWTNYTLCNAYTKQKVKVAFTMYYLSVLGHTVSVVSLLISIFIFSYFKSLSCQRILLHKNMFLSFIFNSIVMIIWLSMIFLDEHLASINEIGCVILASLVNYTFCSMYFWMLCEGIYLHTLIIVAVFVGEQQLGWYYLLGWGFPIIPTVIYAVSRLHLHNDRCWVSNSNLLYIIHGPIHVALLVNLFFLLNIVRVLITKLRVTHRTESNAYMKAVRATLILVPLMGAHFIFMPLQPEGRLSLAIYEFIMSIFTNVQGLLVAIILCFGNGEVHSAIRRKLAQYRAQHRQRLVTTDSHSHNYYHTNSSVVEDRRGTLSLEQVPPHMDEDKKHTAMFVLNGQSNGRHRICDEDHQIKVLESSMI